MQNLVIVESPTKARTLSRYLGDKYQVEASMGHIRDLPKSEFGVDIDGDFKPQYVIPRDKRKRVNELKKFAKDAKALWLATDPDREGEAIAWHISELLGNSEAHSSPASLREAGRAKLPGLAPRSGAGKTQNRQKDIKRVVFHEITEEAIKEAFNHPRELNLKLVDAQQARRVLDRLVGYKLSPLLWKKVKSGLSAGRVQSVTVRLIVEREREIETFKAEEYWIIEAELEGNDDRRLKIEDENTFIATLIEKDNKKLTIKNKGEADKHLAVLKQASYEVLKVSQKEVKKYPAPPFTTSTLQQAASNRFGLSAKKTMMLAQALYEHGLITYMRTDSVNLAPQAVALARDFIEKNYGRNYLPPSARSYKTKSKVAQEAHEAIRPTNVNLSSLQLKTMHGMARDHARLYDLIWKRMVACQMSEAVYNATTVDVSAGPYLLRANGSAMKFAGWLKIYGESSSKLEKESEEENEKDQQLPELNEGESLSLLQLLPTQHFTEPPPRYNDASLIKKLEELGIGRPSTYAPTLSTIQDRYYVEKREKKFFPTPLGLAVTDFLMKYFKGIIDYDFTARMEDELDEIAEGVRQWQPTIREFYHPFEERLTVVEEEAGKVKLAVETVDKKCPDCGKNLQVKYGRFGKFLACSGFPDCKHTESIEEKVNAICPDCGGEILMRKTRKGRPFYGCKNWPSCKFASWTKPKPPTTKPS